jgi:hypothetical protein
MQLKENRSHLCIPTTNTNWWTLSMNSPQPASYACGGTQCSHDDNDHNVLHGVDGGPGPVAARGGGRPPAGALGGWRWYVCREADGGHGGVHPPLPHVARIRGIHGAGGVWGSVATAAAASWGSTSCVQPGSGSGMEKSQKGSRGSSPGCVNVVVNGHIRKQIMSLSSKEKRKQIMTIKAGCFFPCHVGVSYKELSNPGSGIVWSQSFRFLKPN